MAKGGSPVEIMPAAELKPLLVLSKRQAVGCAIGLTRDKQGVVLLHRRTKPRKLMAELLRQAKAAGADLDRPTVRFGRATVDGASDSTTVHFVVNKHAPDALRVKLLERLRPAGFQHCDINVDEGLETEGDADGPDEDDVPGSTGGPAPAPLDGTGRGTAVAEGAAPASPGAAGSSLTDVGAPQPSADALRADLTDLVRQIPPVIATQPDRKAELVAIATGARDKLNAGDLAGVVQDTEALRRALGPVEPTTPTPDRPAPTAPPRVPGSATAPTTSLVPPAEAAAALAQRLGLDPETFTGREAAAAEVMARLQQLRSLPERDRREFLGFVASKGFEPGSKFFRDCQTRYLDALTGNPAWAQGVNPAPPDDKLTERLVAAIKSAAGHPGEIGKQLQELLEPQNLAIMSGFFLVFLAVQLTPAGWVADALGGVLVLGTALAIGLDVEGLLARLDRFAAIVNDPKGNPEAAGDELVGIVGDITIGAFMALVLHSAGRAAKAGTRFVKPKAGQTDVVTSGRGLVRMRAEEAARLRVGDDVDAAVWNAARSPEPTGTGGTSIPTGPGAVDASVQAAPTDGEPRSPPEAQSAEPATDILRGRQQAEALGLGEALKGHPGYFFRYSPDQRFPTIVRPSRDVPRLVIEEDGAGGYRLVEAGASRVVVPRTRPLPEGAQPRVDAGTVTSNMSPEELAIRQEALLARTRSVAERSGPDLPGSAEAKAREQRITISSYQIGESSAAGYVRSQFPGAEPVFGDMGATSPKSGELDQVWRQTLPDGKVRLIVVEAKGGDSGLGSAMVDGQLESQGTPGYLDAMARKMTERYEEGSGGVAAQQVLDARAYGRILVDGQARDAEVAYLRVQTPIEAATPSAGGAGPTPQSAPRTNAQQFDISDDGGKVPQ